MAEQSSSSSNSQSQRDPGLSQKLVEEISSLKKEPEWMKRLRLKALDQFNKMPLPGWAVPDLSELDLDSLTFFVRADDRVSRSWDDVPKEIKDTFEKLGIPEAERKYLAGVVAQYDSEGVYSQIKKQFESQGVLLMDLDTALKTHPDLVREHFMRCVPVTDNKFAALHAAVWSGGSLVYVPKGVKVDLPLQAYFRMNAAREGQFEHTIIIAEEGAQVHYIEGCTAPTYSENSLHSAVVEIYARKNSSVRYTTVQNWSKNVYNLNTKRAWVDENAHMEWVGGSLGAKISMLYPCSILRGQGASADHLTITLSPAGTIKEGGAKVIHLAPFTKSKIISKSISYGGGHVVYRGLVRVGKNCRNVKSSVRCDSLLIDSKSVSDTFPRSEILSDDVDFAHEATVGKISQDQLVYLMSRGLSEDEAINMIVLGFVEPVMKEIPLEYAVELNRLIRLEMTGSVG